jgi:hypothetical protein
MSNLPGPDSVDDYDELEENPFRCPTCGEYTEYDYEDCENCYEKETDRIRKELEQEDEEHRLNEAFRAEEERQKRILQQQKDREEKEDMLEEQYEYLYRDK